jgi:hypothetical protein
MDAQQLDDGRGSQIGYRPKALTVDILVELLLGMCVCVGNLSVSFHQRKEEAQSNAMRLRRPFVKPIFTLRSGLPIKKNEEKVDSLLSSCVTTAGAAQYARSRDYDTSPNIWTIGRLDIDEDSVTCEIAATMPSRLDRGVRKRGDLFVYSGLFTNALMISSDGLQTP